MNVSASGSELSKMFLEGGAGGMEERKGTRSKSRVADAQESGDEVTSQVTVIGTLVLGIVSTK